MERRKWFGVFVGLLTLSVVACTPPAGAGPNKGPAAPEAPVAVRVSTLTPQPFTRFIQASGTVQSEHDVQVLSETSGRVVGDYLALGKKVARGQALVAVDAEALRIAVDAAQANYDQAKLTAAETDATLARAQPLHEKKMLSDSDFDQTRYAAQRATAAAKAAEAQWREAVRTLNKASVRAPFAGEIADKQVALGDTIAVGTAVAHLVDPQNMKAVVGVGEDEIDDIRVGMEATVNIPTLAGRTFTAQVARVGVSPLSPSMTYPVELSFADLPPEVKVGMVVSVRVPVETQADALSIPLDSLVQRYGKYYVYVVNDGAAEERQVTPGRENGVDIVLTEGVQTGEQVVVVGQEKLKNNSSVTIIE
ncbi:MAG TPA: efflux RND transporter periplasmic adaptor subunit [bacterium]|nr:efflux RND transporter periplasmic adaptor subunit [bacterium]